MNDECKNCEMYYIFCADYFYVNDLQSVNCNKIK